MNKKLLYTILSVLFILNINCFEDANSIRHKRNRETEQTRRVIELKEKERGRGGNEKTEYTSNIIKMEKRNGVYYIPVLINDVKMKFIFDTGASDITISVTEAEFLIKQGTLTKEDVIGTANYSDANGDVNEGTVINLKTVQLGNKVLHNIRASIVHNDRAPLLLGQSALEKFGKVSIDYKKGIIILE